MSSRNIRIAPNLFFVIAAVSLIALATAACIQWGFGLADVPWNHGSLTPVFWVATGALWLACLGVLAGLRIISDVRSVNWTVKRVTFGVLGAPASIAAIVWLGLLTFLGLFGGGESALPFGVLGASPALILAAGLLALFFSDSWWAMAMPTTVVLFLICFSILVAAVWRPESTSDLGYPSLSR